MSASLHSAEYSEKKQYASEIWRQLWHQLKVLWLVLQKIRCLVDVWIGLCHHTMWPCATVLHCDGCSLLLRAGFGNTLRQKHALFETERETTSGWGLDHGCHNSGKSLCFLLDENNSLFLMYNVNTVWYKGWITGYPDLNPNMSSKDCHYLYKTVCLLMSANKAALCNGCEIGLLSKYDG